MAEDLPNEELLMKYLDNELSPEESAALEDHLREDEDLRKRLDGLRMAKEAVRYYGLQNDVAKVRARWEQSHPVPKKAKVISMGNILRYGLLAACLLAVIIGITVFVRSSLSPDKVYGEAYVQYTLDRSRSNKQDDTPIENAYQHQNFREVIRLSQQVNLSIKESLLTGIAYLNENSPQKAIPLFDQVRQDSSGIYQQDGEFYLGLAYLKAKQYNKSLEFFNKIHSDPNHLYHQMVSEKLIHDIEKLQ